PTPKYRPVGVWMLLGHHAPPRWLVDGLWVIAWASTACMLVGLASRAATAVSFVSAVALASLVFAGSATWSHQYNVVFIAQLAFVGARAGDTLSVDAWIRKRRGLPAMDVPRGYQWSLRLVQLAVAVMFACAAFHKIMHGHFTLRWALSDSLRNHLLVNFDLAQVPRTAIADWIIDDPWKYRAAAMLNLISQLAPLGACIFIKRPLVRAVCGAFFVIETVALDQVVALWNPHWLPLAAVFVDWEALLARFGRAETPPVVPAGWKPPRAVRMFVTAFVIYDVFTAFVPAVDQWLNTYPFSGFPMFATVRATPPYDEHLPYSVIGAKFELTADVPVLDNVQRWFDRDGRNMHTIRDPKRLAVNLKDIVTRGQVRYPNAHIHGARLWITVFVAPPYPEPARFEPHRIAILGDYQDGTFRTALGDMTEHDISWTIDAHPVGVDLAGATLACFVDTKTEPLSLHPSAEGTDGWMIGGSSSMERLDGDPIYCGARVPDGTTWLIASHEDWHWN
ncbi:MAG TPA: hypothetical protein VGO00_27430, partial [Kofleriaceae bacterium]|nr:hypothetical protein [Kofleriaceae bacterium]